MADSIRRAHNFRDLSCAGEGESSDEVFYIKRDLTGWREVLLILRSVLRWDQPYYPAILAGVTTFLFSIVWYTEISTLTTISIAGILVGIVDFLVPFLGATITGYKTWTATEESQFIEICKNIAGIRQDFIDTVRGLTVMRQQNAKMFFFIVMGVLSVTAWIGSLIDNLCLTYLVVNMILLMPGLRHHKVAQKYLQPVVAMLHKLKVVSPPEKSKMN